MIAGNQRTEKEYRKIDVDSSSSLKVFAQDRKKYKKLFIDNERVEDDEKTKSSITGDLVDCLLLTKEKFDEKFFLSSIFKTPSGNMELFVNSLLKYSDSPYENFEEIAKKAYKDSGYKWTFEKVLEKFVGSDAELFFKESLEVRSKGLTVVALEDIQNAERIVEDLKTNEITKDIINLVNSDRYLVQNQVQVERFEINGLPLKAQIDKIIVDHKEKRISPFDLKCTFSVEGFYWEYYLHRLAYIQAYVYKQACYKLKEQLGLDYYTVENLSFLVCDSIGYMNPLIYTLNQDDEDDCYNGFEYRGRRYKGVKEIVADLKYAKENDVWRISRKNALNGGIVNIKG